MDWKKTERGPNLEDRRSFSAAPPKRSIADQLRDLYERVRNERRYEEFTPEWWQFQRELDADRFGLEEPLDATSWERFRQEALRERG